MNYYPIDFSFSAQDIRVGLPIMLSLVFFVIYWFTAQSKVIKDKFYAKHDFDTAATKHIFFTKYFGFISMGVIPTIICLLVIPDFTLADYGLTFRSETTVFSTVWTVGLCVAVIPLAYISAKKPKNLVNYPQIRTKNWTKKTMFLNLLGWALYLFGYEFLFRGTLLMPLVDADLGVGMWIAIAINTAMYSATHIPKGLDETIGAIPLGIVLCLLTIASGTIWIAFLVHVAMAWTNSLTAFKFHPEIGYKK